MIHISINQASPKLKRCLIVLNSHCLSVYAYVHACVYKQFCFKNLDSTNSEWFRGLLARPAQLSQLFTKFREEGEVKKKPHVLFFFTVCLPHSNRYVEQQICNFTNVFFVCWECFCWLAMQWQFHCSSTTAEGSSGTVIIPCQAVPTLWLGWNWHEIQSPLCS